MTEINLYKKPIKGLKIIALTLPFVVIGIWMIKSEPLGSTDYIMGWISICFFGLGIPLGLFHTFDIRPQIIINENGIWDRSTKQDEIPWEQILGAYPLEIFRQKLISLVIDDTFVFKNDMYKWVGKLYETVGAQKLNLSISQLAVDQLKLTDFINEIIEVDKASRPLIIKKFFDKKAIKMIAGKS